MWGAPPKAPPSIQDARRDTSMATNRPVTEGDLLIAELARRGRRAYRGGDRGATFLIMTADPHAPDDEESAYTTAHVLMCAGEHVDRPADEHNEPWAGHLYDAQGT